MGDLFFSIFKMLGIKLTNILKKMVYRILNPYFTVRIIESPFGKKVLSDKIYNASPRM